MYKKFFIFCLIIVAIYAVDTADEKQYSEYTLKAGDIIPAEISGYSIYKVGDNNITLMTPTGDTIDISEESFQVFDIGIYVKEIYGNKVIIQIYNVTAE